MHHTIKMCCGIVLSLFLLTAAGSSKIVSPTQKDPGSAKTEISPYLEQVISFLKPVDAIEKAATPEEKQNEILKLFKGRHTKIIRIFKHDLPNTDLDLADKALKHIFYAHRGYPPQFRGKDEIDWDSNPYSDLEFIWGLHRFYWLPSLAKVYRETGDIRYAREWAFEINSWIRHMHDQKRYTTHAGWRTLDAALRLHTWTESFDAFLNSPACDGATLVNFLWSVHYHLEYMASLFPENKTPKAYNWTVYQTMGLFSAAAFPEFKKHDKFIATASKVAVALAESTIMPDGVINEYITGYHMSYPQQYLYFMKMAKLCGNKTLFPESYRTAIEKAIQAVMLWSHPDGTLPLFGDTTEREQNNRDWMKQFLADFPERSDFLWFATNGREGTRPEQINYSLPDAGYHILRSGWDKDDLFLILKNTRSLKKMWHNQDDNMTFELSAYGHKLMADSGCYVYIGDQKSRDWFRSPMAHQMISIDNRPVSGKNAKLLTRSSGELAETIVLENEPYPGIIHRRTVIMLDKRCYLLLDTVSGTQAGKLRQHFQFMPGEWEINGKRIFTKHQNKANTLLVSAENPDVTLEKEEGWYSPRYMQKEKRPAFAFIQNKKSGETAAYLTAIIPVKAGAANPETAISFADKSMNKINFAIDGSKYCIEINSKTMLPEIRKSF